MTTIKQQTVTVTVKTKGNAYPSSHVAQALGESSEVVSYEFGDFGDVEDVPGPNRERLIKLAVWVAGEHAKRELGLPSEWSQDNWLTRRPNGCGTACCIAGKIAIEDGGVPIFDRLGDWERCYNGQTTGRVIFPEKDAEEEVYVEGYAQQVLGLDEAQALRLFAGSNSFEDVLEIIREFLALTEPEQPAAFVPVSSW